MSKASVNAIRFTGVDMVNQAASGHPGIVLGAAPALYTLYSRHMRYNPQDPTWYDRDRFVMAAGHGSALLYTMLHVAGYPLGLDDLKDFRQWGSKTPGHPEYGHTVGVDTTTGPLGQGLSMAVGMAIAEEHLRARYQEKDFSPVDHHVYALCGDGDLQEGISQEAASLAGHLGLSKLIVLFDSNDVQLDGPTDEATSEDIRGRFEAMNWQVLRVEDGEKMDDIDQAIIRAKEDKSRPSLIEIKTIIGHGSPKAGKSASHGAPLGAEDTQKTREKLGYKRPPFDLDPAVYEDLKVKNQALGQKKYQAWQEKMQSYKKDNLSAYQELLKVMEGRPPALDPDPLKDYLPKEAMATRASGGQVLQLLQAHYPQMIGGSADLSGSTKVKGADGNFGPDNRLGRNINYGVREHAMAAITNGLCLSGLRAFSGGFFIFSDYMKPAMRLAALMNLPATYVFTHDSVAVGEDGPTHQPVEQLAALRSMPGMEVFRPADVREVKGAWKEALTSTDHPTSLVLSRQAVDLTEGTDSAQVKRGGYVLAREEKDLEMILIASGSELGLAQKAQKVLQEKGLDCRVVSLPSFSRFLAQDKAYQEEVLPDKVRKRVAIEMGASLGWGQLIGLDGLYYTVDRFGSSAPGGQVVKAYGYSVDQLVDAILAYR